MLINCGPKVTLALAYENDRTQIYQIRHAVYALELQQHAHESSGQLRDELDLSNQYIVAKDQDRVIGFVSITTPGSGKYSVDKYFSRSDLPYPFDEYLYEIRLLTVIEGNRYSHLALILMYAAYRWVESHGGKNIVAICRADLADMYLKAGLRLLDNYAISGKVTYRLSFTSIADLQAFASRRADLFASLKARVNWRLPFLFITPSPCYHGGSFFEAIGEDLQSLHKAKNIINADVLDAWFPPSPKVLNVLTSNISWLLQTSPPTYASGLIKVIAEVRGLKLENILPGAGSSDLIFLAFQSLLNKDSRVLIMDPSYGEYFHVLENVVQCQVTRFKLRRQDGFVVDLESLKKELQKGYDMVVLVNPNSPTGVHVKRTEMERLIADHSRSTLFWIDETYVDFTGPDQTLEAIAINCENLIVCKSMSKVYSLSGLRAAYLCSAPHHIEALRSLMPPWAVSLPAQAGAIAALTSSEYYLAKYLETAELRTELQKELHKLGIQEIIDGVANFLLFFLPQPYSVLQFVDDCKRKNLYLRDVSNMGKSLGPGAVRIAVKDRETNARMIEVLDQVLSAALSGYFLQTPDGIR